MKFLEDLYASIDRKFVRIIALFFAIVATGILLPKRCGQD